MIYLMESAPDEKLVGYLMFFSFGINLS